MMTALAAAGVRAELKIDRDEPAPSFTAATSVAANVIANRTNQPISAE